MPTQTDLDSRTEHSPYAEQRYERHRQDRRAFSASEYAVLVQGYLREWVCMGQCYLYIQSAYDTDLIDAIKVYLSDVCDPNFSEMKALLEDNGYPLPASPEQVAGLEEISPMPTPAINDAMIVIAQWFAARAFMDIWSDGAKQSQRTDVRDAFLRCYHRANRWHLAFYDLAVGMGALTPLPTLDPATLGGGPR